MGRIKGSGNLLPQKIANDYPRGAKRKARFIHDGSLRNHAVASRDGRVEPGEPKAYLKQYVEGASGEPARLAAAKPRPSLS